MFFFFHEIRLLCYPSRSPSFVDFICRGFIFLNLKRLGIFKGFIFGVHSIPWLLSILIFTILANQTERVPIKHNKYILFDGLAYNTCRYFASCVVFFRARFIIIRGKFFFLFISREPITWPANNCLQIMVYSWAMPSNCVAEDIH